MKLLVTLTLFFYQNIFELSLTTYIILKTILYKY